MNKELNNNLLRLTDTTEPNVNNNTIISGLSIKMALSRMQHAGTGIGHVCHDVDHLQ